MSNFSIQPYKVYYDIDMKTGARTLKKGNYSEFMQLLAEAEEEERNAPVGTGKLTKEEIRDLAEKYDPQNMSQEEYERFIAYLVEKNVLSKKETYDIGLSCVTIRPGCYIKGGFAPNLPANAMSIRTLKDAGGDAIYWAKLMAQWCNRNSWSDRIKYDALQKVSDILLEMDSVQKQV